jgi:hypothetical protein
VQDFFVFNLNSHGKKLKKGKDFSSVIDVATGKFAHNKRMAHHIAVVQEYFEFLISFPQV